MERKKFDLAVIGAGPGGYVAAIRAAQMGLSVCLIEKKALGGTCLNVGCIPTKTLLSGAQLLQRFSHAAELGISVGSLSFDYAKMVARKNKVVGTLSKGLEGLIRANQISLLFGQAEFVSSREIKVKGEENLLIEAEQTIIASGSEPLDVPAFPCDHQHILNSTSILDLTSLPKSLAIIGGGYIGCEFASLFADLGVKVTILEALPNIVMPQGKAISETLTRAFIAKGITIQTQVRVEGIDVTPSGLHIRLQDKPSLSCEKALVAIGRKIATSQLGLEKAGVLTNEKGMIVVDEKMRTNISGIYAIGDVTGHMMLAHVASHQGLVAATNAAGKPARMHYEVIPAVIFTHPEIATVGMTLEQAQEAGHLAAVGKFPFQSLGKSLATGESEGFAQIIVNPKTGQILGAQVVGSDASALIAEMALAMTHELTLDCILDTIHAHPTLPECWLEAALIANGTPIHAPPRLRS